MSVKVFIFPTVLTVKNNLYLKTGKCEFSLVLYCHVTNVFSNQRYCLSCQFIYVLYLNRSKMTAKLHFNKISAIYIERKLGRQNIVTSSTIHRKTLTVIGVVK